MKLSSREKIAITISALFFIAGIVISFWLCDATWLSRFGALIVIVGVVFAFSDLPEKLEKNARRFIKLKTVFKISSEIEKTEDEDRSKSLTQKDKEKITKNNTPSEKTVNKEAKRSTNRFHMVEVTIVCVGTFTNGFGQWILETIWKYA